MVFEIDINEAQRRLAAHECLGCKLGGMEIDISSGFHRHYCFNC